MTASHPTHSASWAGLAFVKVRTANLTSAACHDGILSHRLSSADVRRGAPHRSPLWIRSRRSAAHRSAAKPSNFAAKRPTGAREGGFRSQAVYQSVGRVPTPTRLCRVLLAFLFEPPIWQCRQHRRVCHEHVAFMRSKAVTVSGQIMMRARCQSEESRADSSYSDGIVRTRPTLHPKCK